MRGDPWFLEGAPVVAGTWSGSATRGHPSLVAAMKTSGLKGECLSRISVWTQEPRSSQSPHGQFLDGDGRL